MIHQPKTETVEMSLESILERIAIALERGAPAATTPLPSTAPAEPKVPKVVKVKAEQKAEPKVVESVAESLEPKVEKAIESMLKANKRKEAIALLASFNGAKSKTSIIEQGEEVMQKFLDGAEEILLGS